MTRIFLRSSPSSSGLFQLDRDVKKRLIKVLRLKRGDAIEVWAAGKRWECVLFNVLPQGIELQIVRELPPPATSRIRLILGQAIPKGDRFEWLIQKTTELGVAEIIPLISARTVVRPERAESRLQRWNEIAEHAAAQSENAQPPVVFPPHTLEQFLQTREDGLKLLLHEREHSRPLRDILRAYPSNSITFIVGPEGGWTPVETAQILAAGFLKAHLGQRILRAETAGLVLAAILQYELGDFK